MTEAIRFGTDGLRARAGEPPMDPGSLRAIGSALGVLLQRGRGDRKRVLLGNDGRDSAGWILEALCQGLAAAEVSCSDVGLCTTPALAFLARTEPVDAAIMISASHNPASDNGIKIFSHTGQKLADEDEREIERLARALRPKSIRQPRIRSARGLLLKYEEHLANAFLDLDLAGIRIAVDAAHGGASELAPSILESLGAEVIRFACEPDGFNINEGVGALHPEGLARAIGGADLGICFDGDGDRSIFVDGRGQVRDGDEQLFLFGTQMAEQGRLPGRTLVATVMSNMGLAVALAARGISVLETPVGDRSVAAAMRAHGYALGGEQSGHLLFSENHLTGDALYTALRLLSLPSVLQRGAAEAFAGFQRFPQRLIGVPVAEKPDLEQVPAIARCAESVRKALGERGRLVLRYSGTEPLCRVMVEGEDEATVARLCEDLAQVIRREIGS
ncbi:MAG: phosphoglucosamine mutase [Planctomycetota bacterium]